MCYGCVCGSQRGLRVARNVISLSMCSWICSVDLSDDLSVDLYVDFFVDLYLDVFVICFGAFDRLVAPEKIHNQIHQQSTRNNPHTNP